MTKSPKPIDYEKLLKKISSAKVLCIGDLILDVFIKGSVQRLSREAPIPILLKSDSRYSLGGVGNVAANIASLGASCHLIAPVGKDQAAGEVQKILLDKASISPALEFCEDRFTTEKQRYIADRQQILRVDTESNEHISDDVAKSILETATYLIKDVTAMILSDYNQGALPAELLQSLIKLAKKHKVLTFVDPRNADFSIYKGVDFATPNRAELYDATGMELQSDKQVETAAKHIIKTCGIANLLVTRSEQGMSLITAKQSHHIPTQAIDVFDVAGAGDTVIAAFALAQAAGFSAVEATTFANIAAGVVVEKNEVATVSPQEILDRISELDFRTSRLQRRAKSATIDKKIMKEKDAVKLIASWRQQGAEIGFTNGCFDIVHTGHLHLLQQAAGQCDKLIVAVNSDASVRKLKGSGRPVQDESRRVEFLAHLDMVDMVVVFGEDTPKRLVEVLSPDVLIKGSDYKRSEVIGGDFVESKGGRVFLADLKDGFSSTAIINSLYTKS